MRIRSATSNDADTIRDVHLSAFPHGEAASVAKLAVDLLFDESAPPTLSLVAEVDGGVVGHIAFSPVRHRDTEACLGCILAPLAVAPNHQKRGVGRKLIEVGCERLSQQGTEVLLVYGDPEYYGRFGFASEVAALFTPPYELSFPFGWQGLALREGAVPSSPVPIACVPALGDPSLW